MRPPLAEPWQPAADGAGEAASDGEAAAGTSRAAGTQELAELAEAERRNKTLLQRVAKLEYELKLAEQARLLEKQREEGWRQEQALNRKVNAARLERERAGGELKLSICLHIEELIYL